jgi:hypothetical protein
MTSVPKIFLSLAFFAAALPVHALPAYDGVPLYTVGDARLLSLGGAFLGQSNDLNGVRYNPAGLVFRRNAYDAGFTAGQVNKTPVDLDGDGKTDGLPVGYLYAGALVRGPWKTDKKRWAVGLVYQEPFFMDFEFDGPADIGNGTVTRTRLEMKVSVQELALPVSVRLTDRFGMGAVLRYARPKESFFFALPDLSPDKIDLEDASSGFAVDGGLMFRFNDKVSLGAAVRQGRRFRIDESLNRKIASDGSIPFFRDVETPFRAGVGLAMRPRPIYLLLADVNYTRGSRDSAMVGSALVPAFREFRVTSGPSFDWRAGLETYLVNTPRWGLTLRGGGYTVPKRIEGVREHIHGTAGFQLRYKIVKADLAWDKTKDFSVFAQSLGLAARF